MADFPMFPLHTRVTDGQNKAVHTYGGLLLVYM